MRNLIVAVTLICFVLTGVCRAEGLVLSAPGQMIALSPQFQPSLLKGIKVHTDDPFRIDFILDKGDSSDRQEQASATLVKYFLAALTTPEKDIWVNLSPYEKDRIVPDEFGVTDMGRDLLAQDYLLKQITSSVIYPEGETGRKFWAKVYQAAYEKYGTTDIFFDTFNKVWIIPDHAKVYEHGDTAFIVNARLKVMLEQDYLALENNTQSGGHPESVAKQAPESGVLTSQVIRDIVIPELEKEVNEGANFAPLRQVYHSLVLAIWFKKRMKDGIIGRKYMDRNMVAGIDIDDKDSKQKIYEQYLAAFKKGVFNYVKEEVDPSTRELLPRKYFSGGFGDVEAFAGNKERLEISRSIDPAELPDVSRLVNMQVDLGNRQDTQKLEQEFDDVWGNKSRQMLAKMAPYFNSSRIRTLVDGLQVESLQWVARGLGSSYIYSLTMKEGDQFIIFTDGPLDRERMSIKKIYLGTAQNSLGLTRLSSSNGYSHFMALPDNVTDTLSGKLRAFLSSDDGLVAVGAKTPLENGQGFFLPLVNPVYQDTDKLKTIFMRNGIVRHLMRQLPVEGPFAQYLSLQTRVVRMMGFSSQDETWYLPGVFNGLKGMDDLFAHELTHEAFRYLSDAQRDELVGKLLSTRTQLARVIHDYANYKDVTGTTLANEMLAFMVAELSKGSREVSSSNLKYTIIQDDIDLLKQYKFLPSDFAQNLQDLQLQEAALLPEHVAKYNRQRLEGGPSIGQFPPLDEMFKAGTIRVRSLEKLVPALELMTGHQGGELIERLKSLIPQGPERDVMSRVPVDPKDIDSIARIFLQEERRVRVENMALDHLKALLDGSDLMTETAYDLLVAAGRSMAHPQVKEQAYGVAAELIARLGLPSAMISQLRDEVQIVEVDKQVQLPQLDKPAPSNDDGNIARFERMMAVEKKNAILDLVTHEGWLAKVQERAWQLLQNNRWYGFIQGSAVGSKQMITINTHESMRSGPVDMEDILVSELAHLIHYVMVPRDNFGARSFVDSGVAEMVDSLARMSYDREVLTKTAQDASLFKNLITRWSSIPLEDIRNADERSSETRRLEALEKRPAGVLKQEEDNRTLLLRRAPSFMLERTAGKDEALSGELRVRMDKDPESFIPHTVGKYLALQAVTLAGGDVGLAMTNLGIMLREDPQIWGRSWEACLAKLMDVYARGQFSADSKKGPADPSMNGGIDLTAGRMNIDIDSQAGAQRHPIDLKALENVEINGLYIKTIRVSPLENLPRALGLSG